MTHPNLSNFNSKEENKGILIETRKYLFLLLLSVYSTQVDDSFHISAKPSVIFGEIS
jgi:hypothetical protein